jgi:DNA polymerase III sliding clamp (beta) subunit (PCNA family)
MDDLRDAINRAVLMSGMTHLLKITCSGFNMHIESCDFDFGKKSSEDVACNVIGNEITLGVNGEFLMNFLNALESNKVVISMIDSARPIVFREGNTTILQMPMRLA